MNRYSLEHCVTWGAQGGRGTQVALEVPLLDHPGGKESREQRSGTENQTEGLVHSHSESHFSIQFTARQWNTTPFNSIPSHSTHFLSLYITVIQYPELKG